MRSLTLHICSGWASLASAWQRAPAHGRVRSQRQGVCPAPEACSVWGRRPSPPTRACRALPAPHRGVALLLRESLLLWKVQLLTLPSPTRGSCPRPHSPETPTADSQVRCTEGALNQLVGKRGNRGQSFVLMNSAFYYLSLLLPNEMLSIAGIVLESILGTQRHISNHSCTNVCANFLESCNGKRRPFVENRSPFHQNVPFKIQS